MFQRTTLTCPHLLIFQLFRTGVSQLISGWFSSTEVVKFPVVGCTFHSESCAQFCVEPGRGSKLLVQPTRSRWLFQKTCCFWRLVCPQKKKKQACIQAEQSQISPIMFVHTHTLKIHRYQASFAQSYGGRLIGQRSSVCSAKKHKVGWFRETN